VQVLGLPTPLLPAPQLNGDDQIQAALLVVQKESDGHLMVEVQLSAHRLLAPELLPSAKVPEP